MEAQGPYENMNVEQRSSDLLFVLLFNWPPGGRLSHVCCKSWQARGGRDSLCIPVWSRGNSETKAYCTTLHVVCSPAVLCTDHYCTRMGGTERTVGLLDVCAGWASLAPS